MSKTWIASTIAVAVLAGVAFATQFAGGGYVVTGVVTGTAAVDPSGTAGTMNTGQYGSDFFVWDPANGEYRVYDGGPTGALVSEIVVSGPNGNPPAYSVQYFDPYSGAPQGAGTWTQTS